MRMYGIAFDEESSLSQYRQLVDQLRARISDGSIPGGARLASTRELSESLGIARSIVLEALDQLKMEGFLRTERGSGTYVRKDLVWDGGSAASALSYGGSRGNSPDAVQNPALSFAPGLPDLSLFPRRQWAQCYKDAIEYATNDDLSYNRPSGRWDLRQAIARHLLETKGIRVGPERVIVTAGSSQAFAMLASLFSPPRVVMEDPQAPFVRRIFQGLGAEMTYVPVDDEGIVPELIPDARQDFIYVTPAHQFPVGGTLSAARRVALLQRAREIGAWVIEDDFDSEYRYEGHPVAPLHTLAPERVAYVGTFSKNVSPALRIGYAILPPGLQAGFKTLKRRWDLWNEGLQQKAMAAFIEGGHLERHLRRCHRLYREKNAFLKKLVEDSLAPEWTVIGATTGMHLVLRRRANGASGANDAGGANGPNGAQTIVEGLAARGIEIEPVSAYCRENPGFGDCLIVAFANRTEEELKLLVAALADLSK